MLLTQEPVLVSSYNLHIGCGIRIQYVVTAYWMRAPHIVCGSRILYAVLHFDFYVKKCNPKLLMLWTGNQWQTYLEMDP